MKFLYQDIVKVKTGFYKGCIGEVIAFEEEDYFEFDTYKVKLRAGGRIIELNEHKLELLYD